MGSVRRVFEPAVAFYALHPGVAVREMEEAAGGLDGNWIGCLESPKIDAGIVYTPVAGTDIGAEVQFRKLREAGEWRREADPNPSHAEGNNCYPGHAIDEVEFQCRRDEVGDCGWGDRPVGKEQIAPPLGQDPRPLGQGVGPMCSLTQKLLGGHNSRLSLMSGQEIEVKIEIPDFRAFRRQLRENGFRIKRRRVFERNRILETEPPSLRPTGCLLRLREAGGKYTVTYKGVATVTKHKSREEVEYLVSDAEGARTLFERLGYRTKFVYEKYRTEYTDTDGAGIITLDETPIGIFAELEGSETWIDSTARSLNIADSRYITASYGALYLKWCQREGLEAGDMVFPVDPKVKRLVK